MKKSLILLGMLSIGYAYAQSTDPYEGKVGINTSEPKATLDVKSNATDKTKGILTPQVSGDDLKTMTGNLTADQHGMITFATSGVTTVDDATTNVQFPGFHRFNISGTEKSWVRLEPSGLEKIKGTGTDIGWRLVNSSNKSIIGNNAVDLSINTGANRGATGEYSFAVGTGAIASAFGAMAIGQNVEATNNNAVAMGWNTKATGIRSFAMGNFAEAKEHTAVAIGYHTIAVRPQEFAIGGYNTESTSTSLNTDRVFVVGNGSGPVIATPGRFTRSDAFSVLRNGKVGIDIDNFETTTSDAKLQVNGKILANSLAGTGNRPVYADENGVLVIGTGTAASTGATTLTGDTGLVCNAENRGKMNFIPNDNGSDVFGICLRNKDGNYYWGYMVGGNNPTNGTGAFGSGL